MSAEAAFEVGRLYEPIKQIADVLTSSKDEIFLHLPGLIAWFPAAVVGQSGQAANLAGVQGDPLQVGSCPLNYDGHAYRSTGNGTNYFAGGGGYALSGTETWIDPTIRGFTIGGWFYVNSLQPVASGLISKDGGPPQRGYNLRLVFASADIKFLVSENGTLTDSVGVAFPGLGRWIFIAGRFTPSTEIAVFADGAKAVNTSSIPPTAFSPAQDFEIGRYSADDTRITNGRWRDVFICQAALDDEQIAEIQATSAP